MMSGRTKISRLVFVSVLVMSVVVSSLWASLARSALAQAPQLTPVAYLPWIVNGPEVGQPTYALLLSNAPDRSAPVALAGQTVSGSIYVFALPETGIVQARFYLDDPARAGAPRQTENTPPWDFAGGLTTANPFNTGAVSNGSHTVTVALDRVTGGTTIMSATFNVNNGALTSDANQVHLAWVGDPATTLDIIWHTMSTSTPSIVQYRAQDSLTWLSASGALRTSGTAGTLHEVNLTGLSPATAYEYRVQGDIGLWGPIYVAHTAPAGFDAVVDAVFVADTGLIGRTDGLASGTQQVITEVAKLNPLLVLLGGDYTYYDTDKRYGSYDNSIDAWFNQMQPVAVAAPMMPTYGNHEAELDGGVQPWLSRFATPAGYDNRRNYSFDVGGAHFISLDASTDSRGLTSGQKQWLEADLAAARAAGTQWIVPFFHVAPFGDGTNHPANTMLRADVGPLFQQYNVKLAVYAHDQAYERSYPLTDVPATNTPTSTSLSCYTLDDGTVYLKVSPGGKESNISGSFSPFGHSTMPAWTAVRDNTMHHFSRLRFTPTDLTVETYGVKGDGTPPVILDTFRITSGACQ